MNDLPLQHRSILITERSSIGEARRVAMQAAQALGFDDVRRSTIGIVATEAATNITLHAGQGELLICPCTSHDTAWLDLLALDSGPGIPDIPRAMEDGFSTVGTAGHGLGAIQRLSDESSLYSLPEKGTAYWSRFTQGEPTPAQHTGVLNIPVKGETVCGDSFFIKIDATRSLYMLVDGLGHGISAHEAANEAVAVVGRSVGDPLTEILTRTHHALKATRGAAMSIAIVDHEERIVTYGGIGNVSGTLVHGTQSRSMVSQNGTLGAALPRDVQQFRYPFEINTLLMMFSDGLNTRSSLAGYPGLQARHPALIAAMLYRDFTRRRDDATVLIAPIGRSMA